MGVVPLVGSGVVELAVLIRTLPRVQEGVEEDVEEDVVVSVPHSAFRWFSELLPTS